MSIRCGVVGVGYLGRFHAQKYKSLSSLVGVSDANRARGEEVAKELGVPFYGDYRELFAQVDAVSIASSTLAHYEIARAALNGGLHTLVEKPITAQAVQAIELIELAKNKNRILQVGHIERFNPSFVAAQPYMGAPTFIDAQRFAPFNLRGSDVDVVRDLMIHDLDLVLSLVRSSVKSFSAVGSAIVTREVDLANVRLEFENGAVANISASRISKDAVRMLRLFEKNRFVSIDLGKGGVEVTEKKGELQGTTLPFEIKTLVVEKGDALLAEVKSFVEAITLGRGPVVTGKDAYEALLLAEKIVAQIKSR